MNTVTVSPGSFSTPVYNPPPTAPGWPPSGGAAPRPGGAPVFAPGPGPLGAAPARRGSGAEAMAAVLAGLALMNFIALYIQNPYQPLFGDGALARFIMQFLFGGIWFIIVGLALCLRHRAAAGSAVALLFFAPHATMHAINVTQNDYMSVDGETEFAAVVLFATLTAVVLFGAFIMNLLGGPGGAGAPSKPLQLSEAALAYCMVATVISLFDGIHALMGYPLFGSGVMETDILPMMMAVYACDAISLILGIGAIVVLRPRRSRGAYAGLLAGQAIFWAAAVALNDVQIVRNYRFDSATMVPGIIVGVIVLVFALMAGAPSVGQWFAGVPTPVMGIPAPGVNFGGPVMAVAPAPVAAPQQVLGADGRVHTVVAAAPAPVMGGAPGSAGGAFAPAAPPAQFPQAAAPSASAVPSAPAAPSAPAVPSGAAAPTPSSQGAAPAASSGSAAPSAASSGSAAPAAPPPVGYGSSSGSASSSA